MSVRESMASLITAVRTLVFDPAGDAQTFADQVYQDALDHTRTDVNYLELAPKETIQPGGKVVWLDYYAMIGSAGLGDWEDAGVLQGYPSFAILSPVTSDPLVGHWTFDTSTDTSGQRPPVYLTGTNYDRYAAAVEILEDWAAMVKLKFGFSSDSQKFNLSEQSANLLGLAQRYKMKARPRMAQMTRNDVPSGLWQRGSYDRNHTTF